MFEADSPVMSQIEQKQSHQKAIWALGGRYRFVVGLVLLSFIAAGAYAVLNSTFQTEKTRATPARAQFFADAIIIEALKRCGSDLTMTLAMIVLFKPYLR